MHKQQFVLGKIPNPVFKHGVFKYVEPFELSTERSLEKDDQRKELDMRGMFGDY